MTPRLQNYMEVAVREMVDDILEKQGVCGCEQCRLDVMAIALNRLRPHYVVSEKGGLFAKVDALTSQNVIDVTAEIVAAAEMVKASPRHDAKTKRSSKSRR